MPDELKSFRLRYIGPRFSGTRLPVDMLSDLPAFRDLLVAFAKDSWRQQNPRRKRVPRGFERSILFDLVSIEDGSAQPVMTWNREAAQETLPGLSDSFEALVDEALRGVSSLFDEAAAGRFPKTLSADHIRALNKFGAGLRGVERIELPKLEGTEGEVVFLDARRRKELITKVKETYVTRIEGIGRLTMNNESGAIAVQSSEYGPMNVAVDPQAVRETFDGNLGGAVQFDLLAELDHQDRLIGIRDVYDIDLVDDEIVAELDRCISRIEQLTDLPEGWLDGEGHPIAQPAIAAARQLLSKRPSLAAICKIYPTIAGGILFEFESNGWDWSIEFLQDGKIEVYGIEIDGEAEAPPQPFAGVDQEFIGSFDALIDGKG